MHWISGSHLFFLMMYAPINRVDWFVEQLSYAEKFTEKQTGKQKNTQLEKATRKKTFYCKLNKEWLCDI